MLRETYSKSNDTNKQKNTNEKTVKNIGITAANNDALIYLEKNTSIAKHNERKNIELD